MKTLNIVSSTLVLSTLFFSCNKNESAPVVVDQEFTIEENSPSGTILGTIDASDPDEGQVVSFEIIDGNDDMSFSITESTGILSVNDPEKLDYETVQQLTLTISVSDSHEKDPLETSAIIRINLNNIFENTDGALAHYTFDGNTMNNVGEEYNGISYGISYTPNRDLMDNEAAFLNGTGSYVELPSDFDIESRSISVWFSANEISDYNRVYISDHANLNYGSINMDVYYDSQSEKKYLRMENGGGQGKDLIIQVKENVWYHAVLTIGPASVKAYLNGQLYDETEISYHHSVDGNPYAHIGSGRMGTGNFFKGSIDDLIIYDRVLDASEVELLYQY